jgi:hypothetical protein
MLGIPMQSGPYCGIRYPGIRKSEEKESNRPTVH